MACRFAQRCNFFFINNCLPAGYYYAANIVLGSKVKKSHALFLEFFIGSQKIKCFALVILIPSSQRGVR